MSVSLRLRQIAPYGVIAFILTLSFYFNLFGVGTNKDWFDYFQLDSSLIVEKTAQCKSELSYDGPVIPSTKTYMKTMQSPTCSSSVLQPYDSQYGLQTRLITFFAPKDDASLGRYFKAVKLSLAVTTAALFTLFVWQVRRLFGTKTMIVTAGLIAISPWLVGFARNMYWMEPFIIAPFIVGFVVYPKLRKAKKTYWYYSIVAGLLFLKLLNGYEYITTISISVLIPIVFYESYRVRRSLVSFWKQAGLVAIAALVAFIGAYLVNLASLANYYHSWQVAIEKVNARASQRSLKGIQQVKPDVILNFAATSPEGYKAMDRILDMDELSTGSGPLYKYAMLSVANYLLLPVIDLPLPIDGLAGELLQSVLMLIMLGWVVIRSMKHTAQTKKYYSAFKNAYVVSLLAALSWLLIMPGHALPHAHINGIVFSISFALIIYMAVGVVIGEWIWHKTAIRKQTR